MSNCRNIPQLPEQYKLTGENYATWVPLMRKLIGAMGLKKYIDPRTPIPDEADEYASPAPSKEEVKLWDDWYEGDYQAAMMIILSCKSDPADLIRRESSAIKMWQRLQKEYESSWSDVVFDGMKEIQIIASSYDSYASLDDFIEAYYTVYKHMCEAYPEAEKILELMGASLFIQSVRDDFPTWAERQAHRTGDHTLTSRIKDLKNEIKARQRQLDKARSHPNQKTSSSNTNKN